MNNTLLFLLLTVLQIVASEYFHALKVPLHFFLLHFWDVRVVGHLFLSEWLINLPLLISLLVHISFTVYFVLYSRPNFIEERITFGIVDE